MDPKAKENLLVEEVLDETLVYDLDRHRAHCLNATSGFLLRSADGSRSVAELAAMAATRFGESASEDVVRFGLEKLHRAGLVAWSEAPGREETVSRRHLIKQMAVVGLLLPTVMTLVSPRPAQAATLIARKDCAAATAGLCCEGGRTCLQSKNPSGTFQCGNPPC